MIKYLKKGSNFLTELLIKKFIPSDIKDMVKLRSAYGKLGGSVGICANIILFLTKLSAGILSGSIAIIADSVNNLSDAGSAIVTLLGFKMSEMPPDDDHPYGHGRIEYLSGLFISVFILLVGFELLKSSVVKIFSPEKTTFTYLTFAILIFSILVKLWLSKFNKKLSNKIDSAALMATSLDSRNDAIITSSVLVCSVFTHFTSINIDSYVGLVVAVFIFISGIGIMKDTIDPLLGQAPDEELLSSIAKKVLSTPGIMGIHDFMIHDYGPGRKFASLHAEMSSDVPPLESHDIIDNIEFRIKKEDNIDLVIHYDPIVLNDPVLTHMRELIKNSLIEIDSKITMHDLRMIKGTTHTNWVFDIAIPTSVKENSENIVKTMKEIIKKENPTYNAIITVDCDYTNSFTFDK